MKSENILILSKTKTYLIKSIADKIAECGDYNILFATPSVDAISEVKEDIVAILMYADEETADDVSVLTFLKDKLVMENKLFFVVGDINEIRRLERTITPNLVKGIFERPIDVKELAKHVDEQISLLNSVEKKKILVVDDSGAMLWNIKGWFEDKYQVILANSGAMAIKYLSLNRPDLVLLDYEMPVIDGKVVLEMIRSEEDFAKIPVFFLTSKGDKESVMNVTKLKPEGYLLKTMAPAEIVKTIDDFFIIQKGRES